MVPADGKPDISLLAYRVAQIELRLIAMQSVLDRLLAESIELAALTEHRNRALALRIPLTVGAITALFSLLTRLL